MPGGHLSKIPKSIVHDPAIHIPDTNMNFVPIRPKLLPKIREDIHTAS